MSIEALTRPAKLWSRTDVLGNDCVPRSPGVYSWYFREAPGGVPTDGCIKHDGLTLLYVGIAPKNGKPASAQTLRSRIRYHMRGNAYGSTLRLTLGCFGATGGWQRQTADVHAER